MPVVTQSRLKTSLFKIACVIAEQTHPRVTHTALERSFGKDGFALIKKGALVATENLKSVFVPRDDDEVEAEVVCRDAGHFHYWSGARWVDIDPNDLRQYELDMIWFLRWVSDGLSLPRTAKPKEIVFGKSWFLGEMKNNGSSVSVFLTRRLNGRNDREQLREHLRAFYRGKDIVILTTTKSAASAFDNSARTFSLSTIMAETDYLKFDATGFFAEPSAMTPKGGYGRGFRTARFNDVGYEFTKTQAAIIEALHEAGRPLHKLDFMPYHSKQDDPKGVFRPKGKKHPAWGKLILFDGKGNYWLAMYT